MRRRMLLSSLGLLITLLVAPPAVAWERLSLHPSEKKIQKKQKKRRRGERTDFYKKWLREDVAYIITSAEREVFKRLATDEEKEQFIEQFWHRRDPDLRTAANEFKEEHYRRIAYANDRFASGISGWKTDRGKIYIIHGPPAEIEKHHSGESYQRPSHEGGGFTSVLPFEVWRYRYIEGLGPNVEIEFVDPTRSGEFRLAKNPFEKDEMLFVPGAAPTIAESLGLMQRGDHPYFTPTNYDRYPGMSLRAKDNPFIRYETLIKVQLPTEIKYKDLKAIVNVNVSYTNLPFTTRYDYFRLNQKRDLTSMTLEIQNENLTFEVENGFHVGRVALYGIVTSMSSRVVAEFEHELMISYSPDDFEQGRKGRSVYQKLLPVDQKMRYKLDLVVRDLNSENTGVVREALLPPSFQTEQLSASSLILSDSIQSLDRIPDKEEMFVIGNVKVRPSLSKVFTDRTPLGIYLHIYQVGLDQSSRRPNLSVNYELLRGDRVVRKEVDERGESIQYASSDRVVLVKTLPLQDLEPDRYRLRIRVEDHLSQQKLSVADEFRLETQAPSR